MGIYLQIKPPQSPASEVSHVRRVALVIALVWLMIFVGAYGYLRVRRTLPSTSTTVTASSTQYQYILADPSISNGQANITYSPDYDVLANYSLNLINHDRQQSGVPVVRLSSVPSGQQHANSMLYFGYLSHWDTQGYKPYMRFTLLGGKGSVAENIDSQGGPCPTGYSCPWEFTSQNLVESAIAEAENTMMYNDSYCCNNLHRAQILNPSNDEVSIGVAWNLTDFFFVEDFVDTHATFSVLSYDPNSQVVALAGSLPSLNSTAAEIAVFYDPTPTPLSPSILDPNYHRAENYPPILPVCNPFSRTFEGYTFPNDGCSNYQGSYGEGYFLGIVVYKQPCPEGYICTYSKNTPDNEIQSYATIWQVSGSSFTIQFNLGTFTPYFGHGVYTIYFYPNYSINETVTSYSIFIGSP